jgi:hypothetical protein
MTAKSYHVGQSIIVKISGFPTEATIKACLL